VYRARDTKLNRDIAIKVLSDSFASDTERLTRFTREAQTLASLNHPNIAQIHGLEESDGVRALVMELVEGEDLSQRIARAAISIDEALRIAMQIADALEAAHEQGIIHRDLKPANIKVRPDGVVKVLDFGLAKVVASAADGGGSLQSDLTQSPTLAHGGTTTGMILGTAAYMSPEQARGQAVDKRGDIWAFGVVLYEMLTGAPLFPGGTLSDTLAAVLTRPLDWTLLPTATPPGLRRLLARCLERDRRKRLRDIGDARLELDDATHPTGAAKPVPVLTRGRMLPWGLALSAVLLAGWALRGGIGGDTPSRDLVYIDIGFPRDVEPTASGVDGRAAAAISPDGRTVAMIGVKAGVRRVFVRRLDRAEASEVPDIAGANEIAFSSGSDSLAILRSSRVITAVSLIDQQQKTVTSEVDNGSALAWSPAGIIFVRGGGLWIVSPEGGVARTLTVLDAARHEVAHDQPVVLPGGRFVLFASQTSEPGAERVEAVSIDGSQRSVVLERATTPVWSPTGHLLFARDGAVLAAAFDPRTARPLSAAVPIIPSGALEALASGNLNLSLSTTGTLLYVPAGFTDTRVFSVDRDGAPLPLDLPSGRYANPRISSDGHRLLMDSAGTVIEALDLARGSRARLTAAAPSTGYSTWNADGRRVVFRRFRSPFWMAADGNGDGGPIPGTTVNDFPSSPSTDPDSIIMVRIQPETSGDVFLMSISGAFTPKPLIVTPSYDGGAQLSPDGRWLLYQSDSSGQAEIWLRRYPALDRQWQVSEGGGVQPQWGPDSREVYYRGGQRLISVSLDASGVEPGLGKPTALFADDYDFGAGVSVANYDVTSDGRFIMIRRSGNGGKLRAVVNWTHELRRILASGGVR
jgi:Tol biopolymer transport system component